jgi:hypothetical protein
MLGILNTVQTVGSNCHGFRFDQKLQTNELLLLTMHGGGMFSIWKCLPAVPASMDI